jgi:hypothetical protein
MHHSKPLGSYLTYKENPCQSFVVKNKCSIFEVTGSRPGGNFFQYIVEEMYDSHVVERQPVLELPLKLPLNWVSRQ